MSICEDYPVGTMIEVVEHRCVTPNDAWLADGDKIFYGEGKMSSSGHRPILKITRPKPISLPRYKSVGRPTHELKAGKFYQCIRVDDEYDIDDRIRPALNGNYKSLWVEITKG